MEIYKQIIYRNGEFFREDYVLGGDKGLRKFRAESLEKLTKIIEREKLSGKLILNSVSGITPDKRIASYQRPLDEMEIIQLTKALSK
jgi:hypothetical protein